MSDPTPAIDYPALVREALRLVPRRVLERVAKSGLPGDHHFFVTFRTDHPEAQLPARLRQQHPLEMTVVLQFQFSDLAVDERGFSVTLRFGGRPDHVFVPFAALTAFVDPSAQFGLRFEADPVEAAEVDESESPGTAPDESVEGGNDHSSQEGNVVDFGRFRKR